MQKATVPFSREHVSAGHVYLVGLRWVDATHIPVALTGHFDEPPATQFEACYVADTSGNVRRLQGQEIQSYPECSSGPLR